MPEVNQESFSERFSESRNFQSQTEKYERTERMERFEAEKAGRRNPLELDDRRYKPKLPKA